MKSVKPVKPAKSPTKDSSYRTPARPADAAPSPELDALDERLLLRRAHQKRAIEKEAMERRLAGTVRQLRLRGGAAIALACVCIALGSALMDGFESRRLGSVLILGFASLGYGLFTITTNVEGIESIWELPDRVKRGQVASAAAGAAFASFLIWIL